MSVPASTPTGADNPGSNSIDVHVGARVRVAREAIGLGVQELADAIGQDCNDLLGMEGGMSRIPALMLFALAEKLNVNIAHFFDDN